jgi:uncharacterized protein YukE
MNQAIVDPQELRRFAQSLKKFNTDLLEQTAALSSQLEALGTTWRDQEHKKFSDQFIQHLRYIARFIEANDQHIPHLLRKAQRIEEYLQQR